MTYNPKTINNYYNNLPIGSSNASALGVESMPKWTASTLQSFSYNSGQFPVNTTIPVFSAVIRPKINLSNMQYIDFYGQSNSTSSVSVFKWRIQQANITDTSQLGGRQANGIKLSSSSTTVDYLEATGLFMDSLSLTWYTGQFLNNSSSAPFDLNAGTVYYVDCFCTVNSSGNTTYMLGTNLNSSNPVSEFFYRDKITITGSETNLSTTSPHVTIPNGSAGSLYAGMRVVHANINSGKGANITNAISSTTFDLDIAPTTAATSTTIYGYDLTRSITAGAGTFTGTTDTNKPTNVNFIPFIRIRGA